MTDRKVVGIGEAESRKSEARDTLFAEEKPLLGDFKFGK